MFAGVLSAGRALVRNRGLLHPHHRAGESAHWTDHPKPSGRQVEEKCYYFKCRLDHWLRGIRQATDAGMHSSGPIVRGDKTLAKLMTFRKVNMLNLQTCREESL
jgi:hypothetical protein